MLIFLLGWIVEAMRRTGAGSCRRAQRRRARSKAEAVLTGSEKGHVLARLRSFMIGS